MRPTGITANRETNQVLITWEDGHQSIYPLSLLRNACPCAECRGGHDKMSSQPDLAVFSLPNEVSARTRLRNLEAVGAYAITLEWEDGHHFGIYSWNYLRLLCPCPACRSGEQED